MNISDLYDTHAPRLVAFFARRLGGGDMETARDLAGDVWLKVARRLFALPPLDKCDFPHYT